MKLSRTLPSLAVACAVLAAACGGGDDGGEAGTAGDAGDQAADGGSQPPAAEPTQVAFLDGDANRLAVFEDGAVHPVRDLPDGAWPGVSWSADRSRIVGTDDQSVFVWNGAEAAPDGEAAEAPCDHCDAAFVRGPSGEEIVVAVGNDDVITHIDPETLEVTGTVTPQLPAPGEPVNLHGEANGRLVATHYRSAASSGPDTLSLLDPLTGEQVAEYAAEGMSSAGNVAIDAEAERIAYVGDPEGVPCGQDEVFVLAAEGLTETAHVTMPPSDTGLPMIEDMFFNGEALYATMVTYEMSESGEYCEATGSAGLWRLDGDGASWEQVDPRPLQMVRPVEGLSEEPHTGMVAMTEDRQATFEPTGGSATDTLDLGSDVSGLWAAPTRDEVDLGATGSPPSGTDPSGDEESEGDDGDEGAGGGGLVPDTTEGAIARFEDYLHALGEGDIDTICEIAGPGAQRAEDQGFGPCESTYGMVLEMISPEHAEALRTATVDPASVEERSSGEVHVPVQAVVADVTFTEENLGSYTLAYQDGNWFIVD